MTAGGFLLYSSYFYLSFLTMRTGTYHFLAFDLGATSGRSMLGTLQDGRLSLKELTRFPNHITRIGSRYHWNIFALYEELKAGLRTALSALSALGENVSISAIGIDTWGVDFAYIAADGTIAGLPRAYRDPYTDGAPDKFFRLISKDKVYETTGIQTMSINSLFQLYAAGMEGSAALAAARKILFMPDALAYLFTGKMVCEYTIASTSQLLNARTRKFDASLLDAAGVAPQLFPSVIMPSTIIGALSVDVQQECGASAIPVVAVGGHDTASAIAAVPAQNERFAYLSSGTWSLMGIEVREPIINSRSFEMNFTNEGGVDGRICFLKNITGMWLLEECRREWERSGVRYTYDDIAAMAQSVAQNRFVIDPDAAVFAHPASMSAAIACYCAERGQGSPQNHAEYVRCIFDSLAIKYRDTLMDLQDAAPFGIERLHIIGGGSQNGLLNQMTADAIRLPVYAGPAEATAIGNILTQAKGLGVVDSLDEMRTIVERSFVPQVFYPS
jgi:rhamnulokinase